MSSTSRFRDRLILVANRKIEKPIISIPSEGREIVQRTTDEDN